jgi:hypothetical protein
MIRLIWALTTVLGLAIAAVAVPEIAVAKSNLTNVCKHHSHEGSAENRIYDRAFVGALQNWEDIVTEHDGASWTNIDRGAPVQCQKLSQKGVDWWRCSVVYQPCRLFPADLPATAPMPGLTVKP